MKKIVIYFGILVLGVFLGWFFFGNSPNTNIEHNHSETEETNEIWTCSMHPQIKKPEPGDCPICGMDLIPLSTSKNTNPYVLEMTEDAIALANIQTTIVGDSSSNFDEIILNGVLKADETMTASLVSHISGRIERLHVSYTGEKVTKGQKIASIYSPELITAQRELLEAKKMADSNPAILLSAKNKLKYWKINENIIEEILETEEIQEYFFIYAEHNGVVKVKNVDIGDYIDVGEVLFTTENLSQLWVLLDVYEKDLAQINIGDKITFTTLAYPDKVFESEVVFLDPTINSSTRVATIRAEVNNSNGLLKPEMFISASLKKDLAIKINITVPKTSVLWTGERSVVYVKQPNTLIPTFEYREVQLGEVIGSYYEIKEGLSVGDEIVVNGAFIIDASSQLNNQISMMNKKVNIEKSKEITVRNFRDETSVEFQTQLLNVFNEYNLLKGSLIESDVDMAQIKAHNLVSSLGDVDMSEIKGEAHIFWMEQLEIMKGASIKISTSDNIENQRIYFEELVSSLIKVGTAFGTHNKKLYILHCPMANGGGADWLSAEPEILNPYFGEKMLKCGFVKDSLN